MDFGPRSRALSCSCILLALLGIASPALAQQPGEDWSIPTDDELRAFLTKRMEYNGVGVVIGVIEPAGRRVVAYGRSGTERPLDTAPYPVRKFVSIDPFTLDRYAGEYRRAKDGTLINVVRRRDYLLVDDSSGSPDEMFAETLHDFSTRAGPHQISFHTDGNGNVTGLTWYPRGKAGAQSEEATRVIR